MEAETQRVLNRLMRLCAAREYCRSDIRRKLATLPSAEAAKRAYTIYGRQSLYSGDWTPVAAGHAKDHNFFKVTVEMK